jgi:hypothetical protein
VLIRAGIEQDGVPFGICCPEDTSYRELVPRGNGVFRNICVCVSTPQRTTHVPEHVRYITFAKPHSSAGRDINSVYNRSDPFIVGTSSLELEDVCQLERWQACPMSCTTHTTGLDRRMYPDVYVRVSPHECFARSEWVHGHMTWDLRTQHIHTMLVGKPGDIPHTDACVYVCVCVCGCGGGEGGEGPSLQKSPPPGFLSTVR